MRRFPRIDAAVFIGRAVPVGLLAVQQVVFPPVVMQGEMAFKRSLFPKTFKRRAA